MPIDAERFRRVAELVSSRLQQYGLRPVSKITPHDTEADGKYAKLATWRGRPYPLVWWDYFPGNSEADFWFGFHSGTRAEIEAVLPSPHPHKIVTQDVQGETLKPQALATLRSAAGLAFESYGSDGYYYGIYAFGLGAKSDDEMVIRAARFLGDTVSRIEPRLAEQTDINSLRNRGATTRKQLVDARIGQGRFRADLKRVWGGKCSVLGVNVDSVLRASHIMPWSKASDEERLDAQNGLLLSATLDALFDRGLISFGDDGSMIVSDDLNEDQRNLLFVDVRSKRLSQPLTAKQKHYLQYHRYLWNLKPSKNGSRPARDML